MIIQGVVGQQTLADSATPQIARMGRQGELIISQLHAEHYEQAYRKNMYTAATQAAVTTTVGLATTYTGLCLSNPVASSVNLVLNQVGVGIIVAPVAALAIGLMTGFSNAANVTHTTPGTISSTFVGTGLNSAGKVDVAATLSATPVVHSIFGANDTGAITTSPTGPSFLVDYAGSLIIPPGGFVALYTSAASGASGVFAHFEWEEVPF